MGTLHCALENGADLYVNERQKIRHYRSKSTEERRRIRKRRKKKNASGGSRIDCRGGLSIPRALARAKFYVLRPLLDRLRMTYVLPVRPTRKLASLAIIIIITSRMQASGERSPALHRRPRTCKPNH